MTKKIFNNTNICIVVRVYDEMGTYSETRYDNVKSDNIPMDIMEKLVLGELICVKVTPNVDAFYFEKPKDWPDNWTVLGSKNKNKK